MCELGIHSNCETHSMLVLLSLFTESLFFFRTFFLALDQTAVINHKKHLAEVMQQKKNTKYGCIASGSNWLDGLRQDGIFL